MKRDWAVNSVAVFQETWRKGLEKNHGNISGKLLPQSEPQTGYLPKTDGLALQISHEGITKLEEGSKKPYQLKVSVTVNLTVQSAGICRQLALYQGHDYVTRHLNVMAINP